MRSISASTVAICARAAAVNVALASPPLAASVLAAATTTSGPNASPATKAFIQRDCTIGASVAEKRRMLADGDQSMSRRGHGPSLNYGISPALGEAAAGSLFRLTTIPPPPNYHPSDNTRFALISVISIAFPTPFD